MCPLAPTSSGYSFPAEASRLSFPGQVVYMLLLIRCIAKSYAILYKIAFRSIVGMEIAALENARGELYALKTHQERKNLRMKRVLPSVRYQAELRELKLIAVSLVILYRFFAVPTLQIRRNIRSNKP